MYPTLLPNSFFPLSSYEFFVGMALGVGFFYGRLITKKHHLQIRPFWLFYTGLMICAWIGAKLFFLLFSLPQHFKPFILLSTGGFVFYGGLLFACLYLYFYSLLSKKIHFFDYALFLPALALGHGIGRLGCFMVGCCYGKICLQDCLFPRHPVQLYESFLLFVLGILLYFMEKRRKAMICVYCLSYGIGRFLLEFLRDDEIRGLYYGFSTSQYISLLIILLGLLLFWRGVGTVR